MTTIPREKKVQRKIIIIFILGILCPSLVVGYLSWNAVAKRREALRRIVESQLWISGEKAIESVEAALQEYEYGLLIADRFLPLTAPSGESGAPVPWPTRSGEKVFLLDSEFRVVFPRSGQDDAPYSRWEQAMSGYPFVTLFERAERWESVRQDYGRAAELYRRCRPLTALDQLQAFAWEGYGRCLFLLKRYDEAASVYEEIFDVYGRLKSRFGHPLGPMAALQLEGIYDTQGRREDALEVLVKAFEMLEDGAWQLNRSTHDFYAEELARALEAGLSDGKHPNLLKSYEAVGSRSSPYLQQLEFSGMLEESIVPVIKEKIALSEYADEPAEGRFPLTFDESCFLISYSRLAEGPSAPVFYAGFCWSLDHVKNRLLPKIAADVEQTLGIKVQLVDASDPVPGSGQASVIPKDTLIIAADQFPFPWRYVVSRSDLGSLERAARRENILSGLLLAVLIGLMSFGAFLLARDVTREADSAAQKSRFIDNVSHELKTPLTLIRLYGETLKNQRHLAEDSRREAYEIITGESERLSHMISNVLDMSRIERKVREFNVRTSSIAEAVKATLESYRYHLDKKGFTVREEIDSGIPPVDFDREAMASVVINLLGNATKFSRETKDVLIRVFRRGDQAVVQVADKGIGMPSQDIGRIFERYYRSRIAANPDAGGSGLGLAIVKHIVEAHGGRIEVESEPGKGSVFSVFLPLSVPREGRP
jgi:signal transduction histidine kinase/tetratricopeptide (TPR) repeat protein